jgi:hypothetical protein
VFCAGAALKNTFDTITADGSRRDGVDADIVLAQFTRQCFGEADQPGA